MPPNPPAVGEITRELDRMVNKAAERERFASFSPFERIREKDYYSFAAIRADAHEAFARLRSDYTPGDDIPF